MNILVRVAGVAALAAGCSEPQTPPSASEPAPAAATATLPPSPTSVPVASDGGGPSEFFDTDRSLLTSEELLGMWSDVDNCGRPIVFNADGSFTDHTGATGQWTLRDQRLAMTKNGRTTEDHVNPFDANTFAFGPEDGGVRVFMRCQF